MVANYGETSLQLQVVYSEEYKHFTLVLFDVDLVLMSEYPNSCKEIEEVQEFLHRGYDVVN